MSGELDIVQDLAQIAREDDVSLPKTTNPTHEPFTVSINTPHTASVHGRAIALQIKNEPLSAITGGSGSSAALGPIVLTLSKNGMPTDYNVNAEEA